MLDRVAVKLKRSIYEVPVGFKWFVDGLLAGTLGFAGEESAGASFLRLDGTVWTTDKDGIVPALLSAEITAKLERDPGEIYADLERELGTALYTRIDASANTIEKQKIAGLVPENISLTTLAGEPIQAVLTHAPGNQAPLGGVKITTKGGWCAVRPSGTEDIYKLYAESFYDNQHLQQIVTEAQQFVDSVLKGVILK
jgi:phosphoglucomutase